MSYETRLAAALSGATVRQLEHWRADSPSRPAILIPEVSSTRPLLYSFRDIVALRACVKLRSESSLQKIRRALDALRVDLGEIEHLSHYTLVSDGSSIYMVEGDAATDLVRQRANTVIGGLIEVIAPFYSDGRRVPDLLRPRANLRVDPAVRGGEPVIKDTRIPFADVAALVRDGVRPDQIVDYYPVVSAVAATDASDFADYVDSYAPRRAAA